MTQSPIILIIDDENEQLLVRKMLLDVINYDGMTCSRKNSNLLCRRGSEDGRHERNCCSTRFRGLWLVQVLKRVQQVKLIAI
jgi:hypothetical protein